MLRTLALAATILTALALPPGASAQTAAPTTPATRPSNAPALRPNTPAPVTPAPVAPSPVTPAPTGRGTAATTPTTPAPARAATTASPSVAPSTFTKKIDVNGASEADLAALPGIGPVTAKAIVAGRPWDDLNDLVAKKAVNQPTFERNKDRFALANINTSSAPDMARTLPGIGEKTAPKIVAARPYATPQDLVAKKIISQRQFDRIKDLVTY